MDADLDTLAAALFVTTDDLLTELSERPSEVEDRTAAGHWEGDLITGHANRSAIATLAERASGYTVLVHLPGRHTAEVTTRALIAAFAGMPAGTAPLVDLGRGTAMADHAQVTEATRILIVFAAPHSPWQRGSNKNTNGAVRVV